ncbi:MAG TPA: MFS transporter [Candidatus Limnocylindria bacterium]|nr:MFS transporter [Candidatus Limnocylindria bacterium]
MGAAPVAVRRSPRRSEAIASAAPRADADVLETEGRWAALAVVSTGTLLALAPWFSASAVTPLLAADWHPSGLQLTFLAIAVQLGFAAGALTLAATGVVDVVPGRWLFPVGAIVAGAANLAFAFLATDPGSALPFRFLTGAGIAAVYPVALKHLAGWFRAGRGLAIGILIGAITVGSALPYLVRAAGATSDLDWRAIVAATSVLAVAGGLLVGAFGRAGPLETPATRFSPRIAATAFRSGSVRLATLGYRGHMWELYAMWTWVPAFIAASFAVAGTTDPSTSSLAAFAVVAAGGVGCIGAGAMADRLGRTTLTIAAMAISGASAIAIGFFFGAPPALLLTVAIIWGITVVADSAQFSAAVSELAPPGTAGSALSVQLAVGFVLTGVTILGIGLIGPNDATAWRLAFASLALGPIVGIIAMWHLRSRSDAPKMAGGHR